MVAMTIVVMRTTVRQHVAQNIVARVAHHTAALLRNLVAALDHARRSAVDQVALAVSVPQCMRGLLKVEVLAAPKVSGPHRVAMTNAVDQKLIAIADQNIADQNIADQNIADQNIADQNIADQNIADQNIVVQNIADQNIVVQNIVAPKHAVQNIVALVVRRHVVRKVVVQKAEANEAQNHVAPKAEMMIADQKVEAQTPDRHVVLKVVARKVAVPKHAAMTIAAPKVAALVVHRRVAKAPAVAKVAVVRRLPAMMMCRFKVERTSFCKSCRIGAEYSTDPAYDDDLAIKINPLHFHLLGIFREQLGRNWHQKVPGIFPFHLLGEREEWIAGRKLRDAFAAV
jgi:hypothetical protein